MSDAESTPSEDALPSAPSSPPPPNFDFSHLRGFQSMGAPPAEDPEAYARELEKELAARAARFVQSVDDAIVLANDGVVRWLGDPIARLAAGEALLKPRAVLLCDEATPAESRTAAEGRLELWIAAHVHKVLGPLEGLVNAESVPEPAREVAAKVAEALGVLDRERVRQQVKGLDQNARATLRKLGVRFGAHYVFVPTLLKPGARALCSQLWGLRRSVEPGADRLLAFAAAGRTSFSAEGSLAPDSYRIAGFRLCGERVVRVDIVERLTDLIRAAIPDQMRPGSTPPSEAAGFTVTQQMTSLTGCAGEAFASILRSLGYESHKVKKSDFEAARRKPPPAAVQPIAPPPETVAPAEANPETAPEPAEPSEAIAEAETAGETPAEASAGPAEPQETAPEAAEPLEAIAEAETSDETPQDASAAPAEPQETGTAEAVEEKSEEPLAGVEAVEPSAAAETAEPSAAAETDEPHPITAEAPEAPEDAARENFADVAPEPEPAAPPDETTDGDAAIEAEAPGVEAAESGEPIEEEMIEVWRPAPRRRPHPPRRHGAPSGSPAGTGRIVWRAKPPREPTPRQDAPRPEAAARSETPTPAAGAEAPPAPASAPPQGEPRRGEGEPRRHGDRRPPPYKGSRPDDRRHERGPKGGEGAPRKEARPQAVDPDSPFAKLAALKPLLERRDKTT